MKLSLYIAIIVLIAPPTLHRMQIGARDRQISIPKDRQTMPPKSDLRANGLTGDISESI
ncbi:MAG: hypothetical protein HN580_06590 [Deltaproteobacteria bacterium]|nr:hypothetical protein [Deltaproteobacteria bacterium]MBT4265179.1 hypothetical protein [Deltaproteobacteria bacterium]MBT4638630.1 hypothetical protein [Deltaproteobacteria bacterium]MBT6503507.1 hypothetical protein [Deltaproteobacteria bacterium]MBT6611617.1 hypothetical protein [Deltaproteobacteria bacterium]